MVILGMGPPTLGVYVLLAALVAPALIEVGIEPIAAHLYFLYFGMMSMITPPIALVSAGLAGFFSNRLTPVMRGLFVVFGLAAPMRPACFPARSPAT